MMCITYVMCIAYVRMSCASHTYVMCITYVYHVHAYTHHSRYSAVVSSRLSSGSRNCRWYSLVMTCFCASILLNMDCSATSSSSAQALKASCQA